MKNDFKKYYLGIDGGGTKTDFALADSSGLVIAKVHAGPTNLHNSSDAQIHETFSKGFQKLMKKAKLKKDFKLAGACVGLSGLDTLKEKKRASSQINKVLKRFLPPKGKLAVVNDSVVGLWSGTQKGYGVCIIGGTGSNGYGVILKGKEAWASGLGHILADQGGGYYLGHRCLNAAAKSFDGRGPKTSLEQRVVKHFKVKNIREVVGKIYYKNFGKDDIAKLAKYVEDEAIKGDKVAIQLAKDAAEELAQIVKAIGSKLKFNRNKEFDLVMIGGVLQKDPIVTKQFKIEVEKIYPKVTFISPAHSPVIGAIHYAINLDK